MHKVEMDVKSQDHTLRQLRKDGARDRMSLFRSTTVGSLLTLWNFSLQNHYVGEWRERCFWWHSPIIIGAFLAQSVENGLTLALHYALEHIYVHTPRRHITSNHTQLCYTSTLVSDDS